MSSTGSEFHISRFDFGALRDFSHPFEEAHEEPIIVDLPIEPEAPPLPPTYSQEQLDRAMAEAREQGRQHGIEEGRQQAQHEEAQRQYATQQALAAITAQLTQAQGNYTARLEQVRQETTQLALAIAKQVCHLTLREYPATFFDTLVIRCLPIILRQPRLIATVHPDLVEIIEQSFRQMRMENNYEGQLEVRANATLAASDAKLHWEDGSAEIRADDIWRSIEHILQESQTIPAPPELPSSPDHSS
jgi:flagellar assembly protein FliH